MKNIFFIWSSRYFFWIARSDRLFSGSIIRICDCENFYWLLSIIYL